MILKLISLKMHTSFNVYHSIQRNRNTECNCTVNSAIMTYALRKTLLYIAFEITHPRTGVHKTWTFLIITHNSWYRSRKIKEDSSTEREKFPLRFEPIFITVQCTSRSQDFSNEKWSRNLQIGNAFNDWNSTIFMQIGNVWPKNHIIFLFFLL